MESRRRTKSKINQSVYRRLPLPQHEHIIQRINPVSVPGAKVLEVRRCLARRERVRCRIAHLELLYHTSIAALRVQKRLRKRSNSKGVN